MIVVQLRLRLRINRIEFTVFLGQHTRIVSPRAFC
jgi:hypothetical protein